jgi:hypothetical protein
VEVGLLGGSTGGGSTEVGVLEGSTPLPVNLQISTQSLPCYNRSCCSKRRSSQALTNVDTFYRSVANTSSTDDTTVQPVTLQSTTSTDKLQFWLHQLLLKNVLQSGLVVSDSDTAQQQSQQPSVVARLSPDALIKIGDSALIQLGIPLILADLALGYSDDYQIP